MGTRVALRFVIVAAAVVAGCGESIVGTSTPANTAPVIDPIADVTIDEDTPSGTIPITVSDAEDVTIVVFRATASDPAVVSSAGFTFGGAGGARTLVITPEPDATGTVTITVFASDGELESSVTFTLTINPFNDAPRFDPIADVTIDEDETLTAHPFTIRDVDDPIASIVVTAQSSDQAVIPDSAITISGTGENRTITATPLQDTSGPVTITLTASDASLTTTISFLLTVNAVNDLPTITPIADLGTTEDTPTGSIAFTVDDVETPAASLVVSGTSSDESIVASGTSAFGGAGTARTLVVTPVQDATGPVTITVTVDDGTDTASTSFVLTVGPVNDPPTISTIANQSTIEDTTTAPIAFTVDDVETPAASLGVTATSSNQAIFADADLVLGGSGNARTLTATPQLDAFGTVTITVGVNDGAVTTTTTFQLTAMPIGDPPTISDIPDQVTDEDVPAGPIAFTIADPDGFASVVLTAMTDNGTLVPASNVTFGGSLGARTVTVTPALHQSGTVTITVTVSDGISMASDSFVLTVNPVNDAPTISAIGTQTIAEDAVAGPIAFTIGDVETAPGSLTVSGTSGNTTLLPNANIVFGGSGASRTVTLTPAGNQSGSTTVTINVSDGMATTPLTFTLNVTPVNDPPTISTIGNQTIAEDTSTGTLMFTVADVDNDPCTLTLSGTSTVTTTVNAGSFAFGGSCGMRTVVITPLPDANGMVNVTITVRDPGTLTGTSTFTLTITPAADPPVAVDDAYATTGNVTISPATSVLANDTDPDGTMLSVQPFTGMTNQGGKFAILANGTFTYTPPAGFLGTDTVDYTLRNAAMLTDVGTITFTVGAPMRWFVDNEAGPGGDGTDDEPFERLSDVEAPSGPGDLIILDAGDGTTALQNEGLTLQNDQQLLGQLDGGTPPSITNTAGDAITLADGNTITNVIIEAPSDDGIAGTGVTGTTTISDVEINDTNGDAVNLQGTGTLAITDATISSLGEDGVVLSDFVGVSFSGTVTIETTDGVALDLQNVTSTGSTVANVRARNGSGEGIHLDGVTGALTLTSVDSEVTGGAAIFVRDATALTLGSAGSRSVSTNHAALDVADSAVAIRLDTVTSTRNGGDAISLVDLTGTTTLGVVTTTTTNGRAVFADNAGTLRITGSTSALASTNDTAFFAADTLLDVTVRSIAANGGATGIELDTTTGNLRVVGNGAAGSGGVLENQTDVGVLLTDAAGVSLAWMSIETPGNDGIRGTNVNGLIVTDTVLLDTAGGAGDRGVELTDPNGTVRFDGVDASGFQEELILVTKGSGTLTLLEILGGTYQTNLTATDLVAVATSGTGSIASFHVDGATFDDAGDDGIDVFAEDTSSIDLLIEGATFTDNAVSGIRILHDDAATIDVDLDGNTLLRNPVDAIRLGSSGGSNGGGITGFVRNNDIGAAMSVGSGSSGNDAIDVDVQGSPTFTLSFTNNVVQGVNGTDGLSRAFEAQVADNGGTLNLTLADNSFTVEAAAAGAAVYMDAGGGTATLCVNLQRNFGNSATTIANGGGDFVLGSTGMGTVGFVGFTDGPGSQDQDLTTSLTARMNIPNNNRVDGFGTIANVASCPTP